MNQDDIKKVVEVTSMMFQASQSKLAAASAREKELRQNLEALVISRRDRALATLGSSDASYVAGADGSWQIWVEQRRRLINAELGKCLVQQDQLRDAARKAFGREQAAKAILKREEIARRKNIARQTHYES